MMYRTQCAILVGLCLLGLGPRSATAGIHTWDVSEVLSNADGTIQFVELVEAGGGNFETGVSGGTITSNAKSFTWSSPAVTSTALKKYLIGTPAFAALTGAPALNAIITADKLPFFFVTSGDSVDFSVYDTCTFGTVPTNGKDSIDCVPITPASAVNSPTNYAGASGSVRAAISTGTPDNFQALLFLADGVTPVENLQNWAGGSGMGGSAPTNQPNGQGGASDRYLQLTAASGLIGTFNKSQWVGNYVAAAVGAINADLNNAGPDPLSIRITLMTPGCDGVNFNCTAWTSTNATPVSSGSGWLTASFSIAEADLTQVLGSDSYTTSLSNIERILIRHDDGAPTAPGVPVSLVTATLGIDNVLPEPSASLGLIAGAALLGALRRRRQAVHV